MIPTIGAFIESSLIEWSGKIAAAIALQGCNFRCPFCHSAPLVPAKGTEAIPFDDIVEHLERRRGWVDGVVVSGGEPLLHAEVRELLERIKEMGLLVKLDTNGSFPDRLAEMLEAGLVDYMAIDVKAPLDAERYSRSAGVKIRIEDIRRSIETAIASPVGCEFRTTLCPAVLSEEDVVAIAAELAGADSWFLQQFRPLGCLDPEFLDVEPWSDQRVRALVDRCSEICAGCMLRGRDFAGDGIAAEAGA